MSGRHIVRAQVAGMKFKISVRVSPDPSAGSLTYLEDGGGGCGCNAVLDAPLEIEHLEAPSKTDLFSRPEPRERA